MSSALRRVPGRLLAVVTFLVCSSWLLAGCGSNSPENLQSSSDAVNVSGLSGPGPFVAGFQFIQYVDGTREVDTGGRPVPVFFFYPADPSRGTAAPPRA